MANLSGASQVTPPGTMFSYNNAGYVVLGRLVEVLDGQSWSRSVQRRLIEPLGLRTAVTLPEQALMHRTAVGHLEAGGSMRPAPARCRRRCRGSPARTGWAWSCTTGTAAR
ncbi:serine hydrolase domain-containing protein [Nonomuraea sp. NPDC050643]|uniref:serine hydrolase domain-containing protein n=1 Tax=Nonomuraea sp. NPDC050643 TaxID=3155660 RepID=UPI0033F3F730